MSVGQSTLTNKHIGVPSAPIDSTGARLPFLTAWGRSLPCWTMITTAFLLMVDQGDAVGGKHVTMAIFIIAAAIFHLLHIATLLRSIFFFQPGNLRALPASLLPLLVVLLDLAVLTVPELHQGHRRAVAMGESEALTPSAQPLQIKPDFLLETSSLVFGMAGPSSRCSTYSTSLDSLSLDECNLSRVRIEWDFETRSFFQGQNNISADDERGPHRPAWACLIGSLAEITASTPSGAETDRAGPLRTDLDSLDQWNSDLMSTW
ncbi:hypothetical protein M0657_002555 [Pyricularia oryzae]|nr:hypothetical protein M9X92_001754 [Pyricularia oryzae]KAI7928731.1 hypothetical protein M0657_002555 [Pyricularia oryzae]